MKAGAFDLTISDGYRRGDDVRMAGIRSNSLMLCMASGIWIRCVVLQVIIQTAALHAMLVFADFCASLLLLCLAAVFWARIYSGLPNDALANAAASALVNGLGLFVSLLSYLMTVYFPKACDIPVDEFGDCQGGINVILTWKAVMPTIILVSWLLATLVQVHPVSAETTYGSQAAISFFYYLVSFVLLLFAGSPVACCGGWFWLPVLVVFSLVVGLWLRAHRNGPRCQRLGTASYSNVSLMACIMWDICFAAYANISKYNGSCAKLVLHYRKVKEDSKDKYEVLWTRDDVCLQYHVPNCASSIVAPLVFMVVLMLAARYSLRHHSVDRKEDESFSLEMAIRYTG